MPDHVLRKPPDLGAGGADSHAQFRLLAGDQAVAVPAHGQQRVDSHQCVAPAGAHLADGTVPLDLALTIEHGLVREPFAAAAANDGDVRPHLHEFAGGLEPARHHLAVAVQEVDEPGLGLDFDEPPPARVARPSRGEGPGAVQLDDLRAQASRHGGGAVRGIRVDVDERDAGLDG